MVISFLNSEFWTPYEVVNHCECTWGWARVPLDSRNWKNKCHSTCGIDERGPMESLFQLVVSVLIPWERIPLRLWNMARGWLIQVSVFVTMNDWVDSYPRLSFLTSSKVGIFLYFLPFDECHKCFTRGEISYDVGSYWGIYIK